MHANIDIRQVPECRIEIVMITRSIVIVSIGCEQLVKCATVCSAGNVPEAPEGKNSHGGEQRSKRAFVETISHLVSGRRVLSPLPGGLKYGLKYGFLQKKFSGTRGFCIFCASRRLGSSFPVT